MDSKEARDKELDGVDLESEFENGGEPAEEAIGEAAVIEVDTPAEGESDKLMRLMADFDNFRRRTGREILLERQRGRRDAAEKLLPVVDSLTGALISTPTDNPVRGGLEATLAQLVSCFEAIGLKKIETNGKPFDPAVHEAIAHLPSADVAEGVVIQETRAGFVDEVGLLRPAQVVVSQGSGN